MGRSSTVVQLFFFNYFLCHCSTTSTLGPQNRGRLPGLSRWNLRATKQKRFQNLRVTTMDDMSLFVFWTWLGYNFNTTSLAIVRGSRVGPASLWVGPHYCKWSCDQVVLRDCGFNISLVFYSYVQLGATPSPSRGYNGS